MSKVTLTFEDVDGQVGMLVDLGEPFNEQSNAHKTANMVLNWLDGIHQVIQTGDEMECKHGDTVSVFERGGDVLLRCKLCGAGTSMGPQPWVWAQDEPRLIKTPDELNAIKASTLARIADQRIEIVRG